jgi:hypothetical protein
MAQAAEPGIVGTLPACRKQQQGREQDRSPRPNSPFVLSLSKHRSSSRV